MPTARPEGLARITASDAGAGSWGAAAPRAVGGWRLPAGAAWPDTGLVLELRPNCECCDRDLDPASPDVFICTYECTWCRECAENVLRGVCPNCGGELVRRPVRPARLLAVDPPSTRRVVRPGCAPVSAPAG